jgi:thioesterase domain-containing protein
VAQRRFQLMLLVELAAKFQPVKSRVDPAKSSNELGIDSPSAAEITGRLQECLHRPLDVSVIWKYPTADSLALYLTDEARSETSIEAQGAHPTPQLVTLESSGNAPPLFCIAGIRLYADLAKWLAPNRPVCGVFIPARGQISNAPPPRQLKGGESTESLAAEYLPVIRQKQSSGPYSLAGCSYDGILAYEIGRQLRELGESVELVAMFDSIRPSAVKTRPIRRAKHLIRQCFRLRPRSAAEKIRRSIRRRMIGAYVISARVRNMIRPHEHQQSAESEYLGMARLHYFWQLSKSYDPPPSVGRVVLFRARDRELFGAGYEVEPGLGWTELALEGLLVHEVPGNHIGMVHEPPRADSCGQDASLSESLPCAARTGPETSVAASWWRAGWGVDYVWIVPSNPHATVFPDTRRSPRSRSFHSVDLEAATENAKTQDFQREELSTLFKTPTARAAEG